MEGKTLEPYEEKFSSRVHRRKKAGKRFSLSDNLLFSLCIGFKAKPVYVEKIIEVKIYTLEREKPVAWESSRPFLLSPVTAASYHEKL